MKLNLIPQPVEVKAHDGTFTLAPDARIIAASKGAEDAAGLLARYLRPATGFALPVAKGAPKNGDIVLREHGRGTEDCHGFGDESYALAVTAARAEIDAPGRLGLLRGIQTLRQMFPAAIYAAKKQAKTQWIVPCAAIKDRPAYRWRGLHLDVSRHFFTVEEVKRFIELLAQHKFNILHWHLTDDQGWRLEIKKYPKLTTVGSIRKKTLVGHNETYPHKFDGKPHKGFYRQSEVKNVVAFAAARGVTIVPEIDMPGHMQAAIAAYPQLGNYPETNFGVREMWAISQHILNPSPVTVKFMENVLDEVLKLFPSKYIHIGGDEALKREWQESEYANLRMAELRCRNADEMQTWFMREIGKYLQKKGRFYIGWDDILEGGLPDGAAIMNWHATGSSWDNHALDKATAAKQYVINADSSFTYFDHYQAMPENEPLAIGGYLPCEKVYAYRPESTLPPAQAKYVLGGQGQLWTEYIGTMQYLEYMAYPRACALAEKLWSPRGIDTFRGFVDRLGAAHRERLNAQQVHAHPLP